MLTEITLAYRNIFDDYETTNVEDLIKDIPLKKALIILGHMTAQLHSLERKEKVQYELLQIWLNRLPNEIHNNVNVWVDRVLNKPNQRLNFINSYTSLLLIEELLLFNNTIEIDDISPTQELNLFKAYLHSTERWNEQQEISHKRHIESKSIDSSAKYAKMWSTYMFSHFEIMEFKDFRWQFIKAIHFYKFCESNEDFGVYLKLFLKDYNLESWQDYFRLLLSVYMRKMAPLNIPSLLIVPAETITVLEFLDCLSIQPEGFSKMRDFGNLRNAPVFKYSENEYIALNLNFMVDKIFQGIQFQMAQVLIKAKATFNGKTITSPPDFFAIFGNEFAEKKLFYKVMDSAFEKTNYLRKAGVDIGLKGGGEPDYYMRNKNNIFLFEYKNVFLNADTKTSGDAENIWKAIQLKLLIDENGKPEGAGQLANVISKLLEGAFNAIDDFDFKNAIIYPIIVFNDFNFNMPGINHLLNIEFKKLLKEKGLGNQKGIMNLVMIDLDSLIKFQDEFRKETITLQRLLYDYIIFTRSYEGFPNDIKFDEQILPFCKFLLGATKKLDYSTPEMLMTEAKLIIKK